MRRIGGMIRIEDGAAVPAAAKRGAIKIVLDVDRASARGYNTEALGA